MSEKGKISAFLEKDGLVQRTTKRGFRHVKWTASSALNMVVNAVMIAVVVVGLNSMSGNTEGVRFVRSSEAANFVSYESGNITISENGVEAVYRNNGQTWVNTTNFQTCDSEMADFLSRCVMYADFCETNPEASQNGGPTLVRTSVIPSFAWGQPAPVEVNALFGGE